MNRGKINSNKIEGGQIYEDIMGKSEVEGIKVEKCKAENFEIENSNMGETKTEENNMKESNQFKNCN